MTAPLYVTKTCLGLVCGIDIVRDLPQPMHCNAPDIRFLKVVEEIETINENGNIVYLDTVHVF